MIASLLVGVGILGQAAQPAGESPSSAPTARVETRVLEKAERFDSLGGGERDIYTFYRDAAGDEVRHGLYTRINKQGAKLSERSFRDGKLDGESREWYVNGTLSRYCGYSNGKALGVSSEWSERGDKLSEVDWDNGKVVRERNYFIGDRKVRDAKGKVSGETFYKNGIQASFVGWHANGRKRSEGQFDDEGLNHGVWTNWTRDGNIYAQGEWRHGKPWSGVCFVEDNTQVGSLQHRIYCRYRDGVLVEKDVLNWAEPR
jgi:antitoxin component YwqK of YwqJK toxin-antitoxin module